MSKNDIKIFQVTSEKDIKDLAEIAREIWWQHFPPIIGEAQVEYMVAKFQSREAITHQLRDGYEYYMAELNGTAVGYTGLLPDPDTRKLMLSKLYVKDSTRGNGFGQRLLDFIETKCEAEGFNNIWLTVNRGNTGPINWYKKRGFIIVKEVNMDIGSGFIMDDYVMEKQIGGVKENVR